VGEDVALDELMADHDATCLTVGAAAARDLVVPGRELHGVHMALDYLAQQNRRVAGASIPDGEVIAARDKHVVVIGGGDTGSDCVGTAHRQGARSVRQFELMPQPPLARAESTPWPSWPMQLRTSHAHEEGCERAWSVSTTAFVGDGERVRALRTVRVEQASGADGRMQMLPVAGSETEIDADLVLLAMGFSGPGESPLLAQPGLRRDTRGNIRTDGEHRTDVRGLYAAGDVRRGASLIVWAIREGRDMAEVVDRDLRA
jgi:glutamate synthase (NADPH/NADH) small chain